MLYEVRRTSNAIREYWHTFVYGAMNLLAHAYLSGDNQRVLLGNLMGDFVKGAVDAQLHEDVQRGIHLHRLIDSYTDANPVFARSRERLHKPFRRFAGILIDIFYDHFLSKGWEQFSAMALPEYAQSIYHLLESNRSELPKRMEQFTSYMIHNDILVAYGRLDGIERVLAGMARRFPHENPLAEGIHELTRNYDALRNDFEEFFPTVVQYAAEQLAG